MSIQKFTTEIKKRGLAKTNRYQVIFSLPNTDSNGSQLVSIFCESLNLPGMSIATTPHRFFGEVREMPYERMFDPVTFTFYVDSDLEVRAAFERWIHLVMNQKTRTMGYYNDYIKPVYIYVINKTNTVGSAGDLGIEQDESEYPCVITLNEAFPKSISSIQMSAESKDIMKVSVQMQYRYWTSSLSADIVPKVDKTIPPQDPVGIVTTTAVAEPATTWDPYSPYSP